MRDRRTRLEHVSAEESQRCKAPSGTHEKGKRVPEPNKMGTSRATLCDIANVAVEPCAERIEADVEPFGALVRRSMHVS